MGKKTSGITFSRKNPVFSAACFTELVFKQASGNFQTETGSLFTYSPLAIKSSIYRAYKHTPHVPVLRWVHFLLTSLPPLATKWEWQHFIVQGYPPSWLWHAPEHSPSFPGGHWQMKGLRLASYPTHCMSPGHGFSRQGSLDPGQSPPARR